MTNIVFVYISCGFKEGKSSRGKGTLILEKLKDALAGDEQIEVRPVGCLSNCDRGGSVAFSAECKFGWVFGEQSEDEGDIATLANAARAYAKTPDGFIAKIDRARPVMARVPPFDFKDD